MIVFYDLDRILKILIRLTRKTDDKISTDIECETVSSLYISEFSEYYSDTFTIIVSVHRF